MSHEEDVIAQRIRAIAALLSVGVTIYCVWKGMSDPLEDHIGHHTSVRFPDPVSSNTESS